MTKTMIKKSLRAYISGGLLEDAVLLDCDAVRLPFRKPLEQNIQRGLVVFIFLLDLRTLQ